MNAFEHIFAIVTYLIAVVVVRKIHRFDQRAQSIRFVDFLLELSQNFEHLFVRHGAMNLLGLFQLKLTVVESSCRHATPRKGAVIFEIESIIFIFLDIFSADRGLSFVVVAASVAFNNGSSILLLLLCRCRTLRTLTRTGLLLTNTTRFLRRRRGVRLTYQLLLRFQQIFSSRLLLAFANLSVLFRYFQRVQQNVLFHRRVFF